MPWQSGSARVTESTRCGGAPVKKSVCVGVCEGVGVVVAVIEAVGVFDSDAPKDHVPVAVGVGAGGTAERSNHTQFVKEQLLEVNAAPVVPFQSTTPLGYRESSTRTLLTRAQ